MLNTKYLSHPKEGFYNDCLLEEERMQILGYYKV